MLILNTPFTVNFITTYTGLVRCMAVSPDGNTLGVGLSSGVLSMVDIRTGLLLGGWRAHEGEVLQVK